MKKRTVDRIPANLEAKFSWSEKINSGTVADLSENGMLINTRMCPPVRANFDVFISLEEDILKVPVKVCRLVRKGRLPDAVGVEISNPPRRYLDFIDSLRWKRIKAPSPRGQVIRLFVCNICHHISFDHAPINCPVCSSTIESFEKAPEAIKRPVNFTDLTEFEKKHIPLITILKSNGYVDVNVTVGEIEHGMDIDDHITFIDFYFNDSVLSKKCISRINFNCDRILYPLTTLRFNTENPGVLTVISSCIAHGNWLAKASF